LALAQRSERKLA